ncbi:MAG: hypothetical protein ABR957_16775 [Terracidiphilus sp.]|jgi:hypothetical protein
MEGTRKLVQSLYEITAELHKLHPHRNFTLDGILVGSLGEVLAEYHYGLTPLSVGTKGHDCSFNGLLVQVKTTQRKTIQIGEPCDHLIALQLKPDGTVHEVFNGPGLLVWDSVKGKPRPKNRLYAVTFGKLQELMKNVAEDKRVPRIQR